jgi:hypothetical protein
MPDGAFFGGKAAKKSAKRSLPPLPLGEGAGG